MIVRHILRRQSRWIPTIPRQLWRRGLASEADSIDASLQNQLKETHNLESVLQSHMDRPVPQIDDQSHTSKDPVTDSTKEPGLSPRTRYSIRNRHMHKDRQAGTALSTFYDSHRLLSNPPRPDQITLELLLASQTHLGHNTSLWNPMNSRYIFGIRQGIHIISLEVTAAHLRRACRVVAGVAERGGLILFVGTRAGQDRCVVNAARFAGGCHLFERWTPGALTNGHQILGTCKTKVVDEFDREVPGYEEKLADMPSLKPDLVVCLNPLENWVMLHECGMNAIPTIGIVDTDANPTWVTYPIPANDDSLRCVQLIAGVLGRAAQEGKDERLRMAERGEITYTPSRLEPPEKTRNMATGGMGGDAHHKEAG